MTDLTNAGQDPLPPPCLMKRVSGNTDPDIYRQVGYRAACQLLEAARHDHSVRDVLDWGCGPGRVAAHLVSTGVNLHGCDPDPEAITWCNEHLAPGQFTVSGLYPPLPYPDRAFDTVFAVSVMTHLKRRTQREWLIELARVLRPGGILLATVHGRPVAENFGVTGLAGIQDHYLDPFMAGILPADYYHTVLQTEAYTRQAWSDRFDVIAYEEAGLELHDLVTCRRKH